MVGLSVCYYLRSIIIELNNYSARQFSLRVRYDGFIDYILTKRYKVGPTGHVSRVKRQQVSDAVELGIKLGLVDHNLDYINYFVGVTPEGRRFMKFFPFYNKLLAEYSHVTTFVGGGLVVGFLTLAVWSVRVNFNL